MPEHIIIRKCSDLCAMHEPCSISESGVCAQSNKPVDWDALALDILCMYHGTEHGWIEREGQRERMTAALREVLGG